MARLQDGVAAYREATVELLPQGRALGLLHERTLVLLRHARKSKGPLKREQCDRVQNILTMLQLSLKPSDALSDSLFLTYRYAYDLLENQDDTSLSRAYDVLLPIVDAMRKHFDPPKIRESSARNKRLPRENSMESHTENDHSEMQENEGSAAAGAAASAAAGAAEIPASAPFVETGITGNSPPQKT